MKIDISTNKKSRFYPYIKRMIGFALSILSFPITLPIMIVFSIIIRLETPGPSLYIQKRVGFKGKIFRLYKLRSMRMDAEKDGEKWAVPNDPRVTKVGKFIRETRMDELPQLFNVIKGEMGLIGPRPERPSFTRKFSETIAGFEDRLLTKPGLTGWAQVNGGYNLSPEEKLALDLYYIKNESITLDIIIILRTFKIIFTGDGAR